MVKSCMQSKRIMVLSDHYDGASVENGIHYSYRGWIEVQGSTADDRIIVCTVVIECDAYVILPTTEPRIDPLVVYPAVGTTARRARAPCRCCPSCSGTDCRIIVCAVVVERDADIVLPAAETRVDLTIVSPTVGTGTLSS